MQFKLSVERVVIKKRQYKDRALARASSMNIQKGLIPIYLFTANSFTFPLTSFLLDLLTDKIGVSLKIAWKVYASNPARGLTKTWLTHMKLRVSMVHSHRNSLGNVKFSSCVTLANV